MTAVPQVRFAGAGAVEKIETATGPRFWKSFMAAKALSRSTAPSPHLVTLAGFLGRVDSDSGVGRARRKRQPSTQGTR